MQLADFFRMVFLAAIWGASFPLMRMSVGDFGPVPIAMIRVVGGSLFLAPLLLYRKELQAAKDKWQHIACVGIFNSAIPFFLFSFAASAIAPGLASVFNATTPLWGALIARIWLGDRLTRPQIFGLAIGFTGVLYLAWDTAYFKEGASAGRSLLAVVACLTATACYGFSGSYTKKYLKGVPPLATSTGSLISAGALLIIPAATVWPAQNPPLSSWWCVFFLAAGCTGVAFVVFYRLLANSGPTIALAVAYMIPVFANLWSWLLLGEPPTKSIVLGCIMILTGTTLATGLIKAPKASKATP
jgi:drug/metabolite transporter (DMT)-like permease